MTSASRRIAQATMAALPLSVVGAYVYLIADYRKYFGPGLVFKPPEMRGAIEDILGFGPTFTAVALGALMVLSFSLTYFAGVRNRVYYVLAGLLFVGVAAADHFFAARIIEGLAAQP